MVNILVAALVAGVVTLVIEYLAKPRVEARKDRILSRDRQSRAVLAAFSECIYELTRIRVMLDNSDVYPDEVRREHIERLRLAHHRLRDQRMAGVYRLRKDQEEVVEILGSRIEGWLVVHDHVDPDRALNRLQEHLFPLAWDAETLVATPWWRLRRRRLVRSRPTLV